MREFLSWLANERRVAASTQDQARSALIFLYTEVLRKPMKSLDGISRAKKPKRLPVVLNEAEITSILRQLQGDYWLLVGLMYGSGLRLMESLRLRVKDLDFSHRCLYVRAGKGGKDRVVTLADNLIPGLRAHLNEVRLIYETDIACGKANVWLPVALARKYPGAKSDWAWQYVFPARSLSRDPRSGQSGRHHLGERSVQKAVRAAVLRVGIPKIVTCHTFRHCFATPARSGRRHPHGAGTARTRRRSHHADLHTPARSWWLRRCQPTQSVVTSARMNSTLTGPTHTPGLRMPFGSDVFFIARSASAFAVRSPCISRYDAGAMNSTRMPPGIVHIICVVAPLPNCSGLNSTSTPS